MSWKEWLLWGEIVANVTKTRRTYLKVLDWITEGREL